MNRSQLKVLKWTTIILLAVLIFPPWATLSVVGSVLVKSAGDYAPLFNPPASRWALSYDSHFTVVDETRLIVEVVAVLIVGAYLYISHGRVSAAAPKPGEEET